MFFVFAADEALFDKFLSLATAAGSAYSFLVHTKDNKPKDQIVKSAINTRQASYRNSALIWNILICIGNIIKDQFRLLLFSKS